MRFLALLFVASCASDTSKLEARLHELEKEVAELRGRVSAEKRVDLMSQCAKWSDVSVPQTTAFDSVVPFEIGESHLHDGDRIVIKEVRGTEPKLAIDGAYVVRGEYTLASAEEATLGFTVRATRASDGCTSGNAGGHLAVKRGSGTFELKSRIAYAGDPSISFFRVHERRTTTRDDEIGAVYFGKVTEIGSLAGKALDRATCKPIDISFPADTKFPEVVPFDLGRTDLRSGDRITIREVRGTQKDFAKDGIYVVRGDYTLASADEADIGLNVTGGCTQGNARGRQAVKKGSGKFELATKIAYVGQPHVTFYVNGEGAGGVYFGKGEFLYK